MSTSTDFDTLFADDKATKDASNVDLTDIKQTISNLSKVVTSLADSQKKVQELELKRQDEVKINQALQEHAALTSEWDAKAYKEFNALNDKDSDFYKAVAEDLKVKGSVLKIGDKQLYEPMAVYNAACRVAATTKKATFKSSIPESNMIDNPVDKDIALTQGVEFAIGLGIERDKAEELYKNSKIKPNTRYYEVNLVEELKKRKKK